jgi:hypothetical protein
MGDIETWLADFDLPDECAILVRGKLKEFVAKLADFKHLEDEDLADLDKFISELAMVKSQKNQLKRACRLAWKPDSEEAAGSSSSATPPPAPSLPLPGPLAALDASALLVGDLQDDLENMNPIFGLRDTKKVGLEEAIQATGITGLEGCVMLALMFADAHPDPLLDRDEVGSLNVYTMQSPFYPALNTALGTKDRAKCIPFFKYLRLALGAMYKCPLVKATFSRGIKNPNLSNYYEGRPNFVWWAFTSSTNNISVTKDFLGPGPRMLFIIDGTGVDISKYSGFPEAEVLVLPGTLLQLQGVLPQPGGLTIVQLKQLPSPPLLDFVHPGLASVLGSVPPSPGVQTLSADVGNPLIQQLQNMGFNEKQVDEGCKHGKTAEEVAEWITAKAAQMEQTRKDYTEGDRWQGGFGEGVDYKKAAIYFRRAADAGYAPAAFALGRGCYQKGRGVEKDEAEAAKWCSRAVGEMGLAALAEEGDAHAQLRLGTAYILGMGVVKDQAEGLSWCRKAAKQGGARAQMMLGIAYRSGIGVEKDEEEGLKWAMKGAKQKDAEAEFMVGFAYMNGIGVAKDAAKAARWIRKAAEQGHEGAQAAQMEQ